MEINHEKTTVKALFSAALIFKNIRTHHFLLCKKMLKQWNYKYIVYDNWISCNCFWGKKERGLVLLPAAHENAEICVQKFSWRGRSRIMLNSKLWWIGLKWRKKLMLTWNSYKVCFITLWISFKEFDKIHSKFIFLEPWSITLHFAYPCQKNHVFRISNKL